jgi:hypothetical protein
MWIIFANTGRRYLTMVGVNLAEAFTRLAGIVYLRTIAANMKSILKYHLIIYVVVHDDKLKME